MLNSIIPGALTINIISPKFIEIVQQNKSLNLFVKSNQNRSNMNKAIIRSLKNKLFTTIAGPVTCSIDMMVKSTTDGNYQFEAVNLLFK